MLPKPAQEIFGSPQPYTYFPDFIFELPYSLKNQDITLNEDNSLCYTQYTVKSFDSRASKYIMPKFTNLIVFQNYD